MKDILQGRFELHKGAFQLKADLHIPARGVTGILGPSGSGKTTLLRCLAGLERAEEGLLVVDGEVWQDESRGLFVPPYRRRVGVVFQEARLFLHLSVRENLRYGLRRRGPAGHAPSYDHVVEMLGISTLLERRPERLSGGEQQRVAIGRALLSNPKLLLMDEPLASLDAQRKAEILPFLDRLHEEMEIPLLLVSHQVAEITRLADNLILMSAGRITASGSLADMLTRLDLPMAHGEGAVTVMEGSVSEVEREHELAWLETPVGRLALTDCRAERGSNLRVCIAAGNVSICLEKPRKSSILNILPFNVAEITAMGGQANIKLEANGTFLLARITRKSCEELKLRKGQRLFAQIKSISLQDNPLPEE